MLPTTRRRRAATRPLEEDDDRTSNGSASVASKRVFRRGRGGAYVGVRHASMRKIGQRANVRMCRKAVHDVLEEFLTNFVAGITYEASAITAGRGRQTLMPEEVNYALQRRNMRVHA